MTEPAPRRWTRRPEGSNWGDFGEDDQIGRMNLITPARRLAGVAEVREGLCFALSLPLDYPGWDDPILGRAPPVLSTRRLADAALFNFPFGRVIPGSRDLCCDDAVTLSTQYSTQWDSLAHWGRLFDADGNGVDEPVYYNGFRAGSDLPDADANGGSHARRLGIEHLAVAGAQGRGVLVDLTGVAPDARAVGHDALMALIAEQRVEVRTGDFLLLWTGLDEQLLAMNRQPDRKRLAQTAIELDGSDPALLRWIDESGIAAICSDNTAVETVVFGEDCCADGKSFLPLHELCLFKLGIHLGELWHLAELARWLRAHRRSAFLLTAPPLCLPGSVGSPVTPVATV
ncbi:cyclase family protein [Sphingomonas immobilis]|uniref:Cyclase family protein n=1 Tax=Sphingomonas immobilis TaxID=3063997 RepID=A0ABT8ZX66_9SPHN|nr:cyclase family protein [Sphingomonas sp. CA1-15]MDO7842153.1 cyclase family protein [Sphingomonas sp. CA1-15]